MAWRGSSSSEHRAPREAAATAENPLSGGHMVLFVPAVKRRVACRKSAQRGVQQRNVAHQQPRSNIAVTMASWRGSSVSKRRM